MHKHNKRSHCSWTELAIRPTIQEIHMSIIDIGTLNQLAKTETCMGMGFQMITIDMVNKRLARVGDLHGFIIYTHIYRRFCYPFSYGDDIRSGLAYMSNNTTDYRVK